MTFAAATAVTADGDDRFLAELQPGWDIGGNANGGYVLATVVRAMRDASGRPDPVTVTGHFLSPGRPGSATITTDVLKRGRNLATVAATLRSADVPVVHAVGAFGDLGKFGAGAGPERLDADPPDLPPPDDCVAVVPGDGFPPPFMANVDLRLHPDDAGFATGRLSGEPRIRGWLRLPDGEPIDTVTLVQAVDALPPAIFNARLPVGWVPTVELTAHVRARPAPGWLRCAFTTRFVTGGFLEEDGVVWDDTDHLVAQSRQLALVPRG